MSKRVAPALILACVTMLASVQTEPMRVEVQPNDAGRRVDVRIGGEPFTSYIWPTALAKPVLFPIRTAKGTLVTRGFLLEPRPGERVDHPHHVGLWFNYGDVNGIDFWNNSSTVKPDDRHKMGTVVHRAVVEARAGAGRGVLVTDADWVMPDESVAVAQRTTYVFAGDAKTRTIDLEIVLTARERRVAFTDNKEGTLGLRVTRALEEPTTRPEVFTDASGRPTAVPSLDNAGVNGVYLTSEGKKGAAVWGTRGRWCVLAGTVEGEPVAVAIMDHPSNPGYPTYWHARGYGLFAANPLGQKALSEGKEELNFSLEPGQSATFRYRVHVESGAPSAADVARAWSSWAHDGLPASSTSRR